MFESGFYLCILFILWWLQNKASFAQISNSDVFLSQPFRKDVSSSMEMFRMAYNRQCKKERKDQDLKKRTNNRLLLAVVFVFFTTQPIIAHLGL